MTKRTIHEISVDAIYAFNKSMREESSDRARVLLAVMWMDHFLTRKLSKEFAKGNKQARKQLLGTIGPLSSFSAKTVLAFCAGWISPDLYHDTNLLRRIRNDCAHDLEFPGLSDEKISKRIADLRTPSRQFYDWGDIKAASTVDGALLIYSGERPEEATDDLDFTFPGCLGFQMAIPIVLAVLIAELEIPLVGKENGELMLAQLPEHMREAQPCSAHGRDSHCAPSPPVKAVFDKDK